MQVTVASSAKLEAMWINRRVKYNFTLPGDQQLTRKLWDTPKCKILYSCILYNFDLFIKATILSLWY